MGELGSSGKKRKKLSRNKASLSKPGNVDGVVSDKKMKKLAKDKKRKSTEQEADIVDVYDEKNSSGMSDKKTKKNKRNKENRKDYVSRSNGFEDDSNQQTDNMDGPNPDKKMKSKNKKRKGTKLPEVEVETENVVSTTLDDVKEGKNSVGRSDKKNKSKKKRAKENRKNGVGENVAHSNDVDQKSGKSKSASQIKIDATLLDDEDEVYQISSGDEDETMGMKRWITKYHRARPGADVLLENINDFLVDYWEQKEKEKKKKEEEAADGGWTVVTHIKGRKKTTDAESGTTVGSVAPLAVMNKMAKKKDNQVGLNFYRFQKREAQRNEIMMLQSKFEQDKKRIQQMRAARKFRPY